MSESECSGCSDCEVDHDHDERAVAAVCRAVEEMTGRCPVFLEDVVDEMTKRWAS